MKYIPTLETNASIQEKIEYLKISKAFNSININWLMTNVEKLTSLISNTSCADCAEQVGDNWFSVENKILCRSCFIKYRDSL